MKGNGVRLRPFLFLSLLRKLFACGGSLCLRRFFFAFGLAHPCGALYRRRDVGYEVISGPPGCGGFGVS